MVNAVVENSPLEPYVATFEDGYRNAVICDAILKSAENGKKELNSVIFRVNLNMRNVYLTSILISESFLENEIRDKYLIVDRSLHR